MILPAFYPQIFDQPLYKIGEEHTLPIVVEDLSVIANSLIEDEFEKGFINKCLMPIWLFLKPEDEITLSTEEFSLIQKTFAALKINFEDVAIFIPLETTHTHFVNLNLMGKKIIDFNVAPSTIVKKLHSINKIETLKDGKYLFTGSLRQLQEDTALKQSWWQQMKILFEHSN